MLSILEDFLGFSTSPRDVDGQKKQAPQGADFKYTSSKFRVVYNLKAIVQLRHVGGPKIPKNP